MRWTSEFLAKCLTWLVELRKEGDVGGRRPNIELGWTSSCVSSEPRRSSWKSFSGGDNDEGRDLR